MPTPQIGRLVNLGFAKESSRGTKTEADFWIPKTDASFDSKAEIVESGQAFGRIDTPVDQFVTQKYAEGDFSSEINDISFGLMLLAALGTEASPTNNGDSTYTHTFSIDEDSNQHPSISVSMEDEIGSLLFNGAMVNSLEINVEPNGLATFTVNFMARGVHDWTAQTVTFTDENHFLHQHLVFKLAANLAGLSAASPLSLKSANLLIEKNLIKEGTMGTVAPEDIYNQNMRISGGFELNYTDRTYRDYMLDGSYKAMRFELTNSDTTIGSGSQNPQLVFEFPRVGFQNWESNKPNDELVTQSIDFNAFYDLSNGDAPISTCTLTNTRATSY